MLLLIMLCISVVSQDVRESFISLRERDFVGEDKQLRAALVARLAVLQGDVNVSDLEQPDSGELIIRQLAASAHLNDIEIEEDYLELNHTRKTPNNLRFNISMDYAELFNFGKPTSDNAWVAELGVYLGNQSQARADSDSGLGTLTGPLADSGNGPLTLTGALADSGRGPGIPADALANLGGPPGNLTDTVAGNGMRNLNSSRRSPTANWQPPNYWTHSHLDSNLHVLEIMKQNIYMVQERLLDIEPVIKKHEGDIRFRIAYVFNRLDEWYKDMRTIYYAMTRERWWPWRAKKRLYYYEHMLRKNIDITYSVELVIYLHNTFMAKMDEIMPKEQRDALKHMNANKQELGSMNKSAYDFMVKNQTEEGKKEDYGERRLLRLPRL